MTTQTFGQDEIARVNDGGGTAWIEWAVLWRTGRAPGWPVRPVEFTDDEEHARRLAAQYPNDDVRVVCRVAYVGMWHDIDDDTPKD